MGIFSNWSTDIANNAVPTITNPNSGTNTNPFDYNVYAGKVARLQALSKLLAQNSQTPTQGTFFNSGDFTGYAGGATPWTALAQGLSGIGSGLMANAAGTAQGNLDSDSDTELQYLLAHPPGSQGPSAPPPQAPASNSPALGLKAPSLPAPTMQKIPVSMPVGPSVLNTPISASGQTQGPQTALKVGPKNGSSYSFVPDTPQNRQFWGTHGTFQVVPISQAQGQTGVGASNTQTPAPAQTPPAKPSFWSRVLGNTENMLGTLPFVPSPNSPIAKETGRVLGDIPGIVGKGLQATSGIVGDASPTAAGAMRSIGAALQPANAPTGGATTGSTPTSAGATTTGGMTPSIAAAVNARQAALAQQAPQNVSRPVASTPTSVVPQRGQRLTGPIVSASPAAGTMPAGAQQQPQSPNQGEVPQIKDLINTLTQQNAAQGGPQQPPIAPPGAEVAWLSKVGRTGPMGQAIEEGALARMYPQYKFFQDPNTGRIVGVNPYNPTARLEVAPGTTNYRQTEAEAQLVRAQAEQNSSAASVNNAQRQNAQLYGTYQSSLAKLGVAYNNLMRLKQLLTTNQVHLGTIEGRVFSGPIRSAADTEYDALAGNSIFQEAAQSVPSMLRQGELQFYANHAGLTRHNFGSTQAALNYLAQYAAAIKAQEAAITGALARFHHGNAGR